MKAAAYTLAFLLAAFGMIFLMSLSRQFSIFRLVVVLVAFMASAILVRLARTPVQHTHVHKTELDVTGDVNLEQMKCQSCGAELSSDSVTVAAGAVYVKCQYCGAQYQVEEAPKW